jgi:hypothetical protein
VSAPEEASAGEVLVVQVEGGRGRPERILRIARPVGQRVTVLEWASDAGDLPPRDVDTRELGRELERALDERRRVSVESYLVRRWLALP